MERRRPWAASVSPLLGTCPANTAVPPGSGVPGRRDRDEAVVASGDRQDPAPRRQLHGLPGLLRPPHRPGHRLRPGHQRRLRVHVDAHQPVQGPPPGRHRGGLRPSRAHVPPRPGRRLQGGPGRRPRHPPPADGPRPPGGGDAQDPHRGDRRLRGRRRDRHAGHPGPRPGRRRDRRHRRPRRLPTGRGPPRQGPLQPAGRERLRPLRRGRHPRAHRRHSAHVPAVRRPAGRPVRQPPGRARGGGEDGGQAAQHLRRPRRRLRQRRQVHAQAAGEPDRPRAGGAAQRHRHAPGARRRPRRRPQRPAHGRVRRHRGARPVQLPRVQHAASPADGGHRDGGGGHRRGRGQGRGHAAGGRRAAGRRRSTRRWRPCGAPGPVSLAASLERRRGPEPAGRHRGGGRRERRAGGLDPGRAAGLAAGARPCWPTCPSGPTTPRRCSGAWDSTCGASTSTPPSPPTSSTRPSRSTSSTTWPPASWGWRCARPTPPAGPARPVRHHARPGRGGGPAGGGGGPAGAGPGRVDGRPRPAPAVRRGRAAPGAGAGPDGGERRAGRRRPAALDLRRAGGRGRPPGGGDPGAGGRALPGQLHPAAAAGAVRPARPAAAEEDQDRLLHRRRLPGEAPGPAPDHRAPAPVPGGGEAPFHLRRVAAGRGRLPTGASTPPSTRPSPAPAG